ncbi:MAG: glutaminase [Prevotella sp.]
MDYQQIIENILVEVEPLRGKGCQATYIPALANVNPDQVGLCMETIDNRRFCCGNADRRFSIQSIAKVFALALALGIEGEDVWRRMGREPSGTAFNSLMQLELEKGKPRNPFINSGAIVVADILMARLRDAETDFLNFVRSLAGSDTIDYNCEVAESERQQGYLNAAIINLLKYHGNIEGDIEQVLHFYFLMCSIEMSCTELAHAFLPFADHHKPFVYGGISLSMSKIKRINAVMQTCGFYDEAGDFSYLVGLPGKSGVGGGIAAVFPGLYSVAVWSPRLNGKGNSVIGMKMLELLTTQTEQSIF